MFKSNDFLSSGSHHDSQLRVSDHTLKQHPGQWSELRSVRHISSGQLSLSGRET